MTVVNSLRTATIVLVLILAVYILSVNDLGTLLPHSTPRTLTSHGQQSVIVQNNSGTTSRTHELYFDNCDDEFFIPKNLNLESPCFVPPPEGYTKPYLKPDCLWQTPRANIGKNDNNSDLVELHMSHQNWALFEDDRIVIRADGGTSIRNFGTNFDYVEEILKWIDFSTMTTSASANSSKLILDTGAGIASVSAAFEDERGAAGSGFKVFSYVLPDEYLRLGSIIADRRLVSMLQSFSGEALPFPGNSFHVVHCRWCWHHLNGFDVWLNEMNRLVVPGGYFVFTFTPVRDKKLLPPEEWQQALEKQPWTCTLHAKIMRVCRKEDAADKRVRPADIDWSSDLAAEFSSAVLESFKMISAITNTGVDSLRILNVNCQAGNECVQFEKVLQSRAVLSTFSSEHKDSLRRALVSGCMGFVHNWANAAPFYPRSFDVIHLLCEKSARPPWTVALKSLELHRLLAPGGIIVLLRASCPQLEDLDLEWPVYGFKLSEQSKDFVLYQRMDQ